MLYACKKQLPMTECLGIQHKITQLPTHKLHHLPCNLTQLPICLTNQTAPDNCTTNPAMKNISCVCLDLSSQPSAHPSEPSNPPSSPGDTGVLSIYILLMYQCTDVIIKIYKFTVQMFVKVLTFHLFQLMSKKSFKGSKHTTLRTRAKWHRDCSSSVSALGLNLRSTDI